MEWAIGTPRHRLAHAKSVDKPPFFIHYILATIFPINEWAPLASIGASHPQSVRAESVDKPPFFIHYILATIFPIMNVHLSHQMWVASVLTCALDLTLTVH